MYEVYEISGTANDFRDHFCNICCTAAEAETLAHTTDKGLKRRFYKNQGKKMRLLWDNNQALDLIRKVVRLPDDWLIGDCFPILIRGMFDTPGFLSRKERQATKAIRGKTIEVWRGCPLAEHEENVRKRNHFYGIFWTTDEDVARRYASLRYGPASVVLRAHVFGGDCYVLDTKNSDIVVLGHAIIKEATPCTWEPSFPLPEGRQSVPPCIVAE